MFWRALIRDGDTTTAGGKVQAIPQQWPVIYDGKNGCFEGDPVFCPACQSMGITKCVKPYRPLTAHDGRQANLDGDLCICKCTKPSRLKALFDNRRMDFGANEIANMPDCDDWLIYAGFSPQKNPTVKYGKIFEFKDSETGKVLAHRPFVVFDNGNIRQAKTDAYGLAIIESPEGHSIKIHLVFESPQGALNYEA
ncbi:PAAR domain-containing protein [Herbaspirillum sp. RTI4]|uniref:PAAR domain-containing protein n=1 Tax=Herbaspirillum sp. RTI4 TaxID=3048640 RepID=UPI002AB4E7EA|nr:PAAR domain-containing protein [Herbaspirillum sp. RTI4]MDY7576826.1 PAAR domain-containing protein [Herbaspirillum sp. RTI4]MEA9981422.1 PAAR domain-containing protein [Herbaspirillum sp. RTI4]